MFLSRSVLEASMNINETERFGEGFHTLLEAIPDALVISADSTLPASSMTLPSIYAMSSSSRNIAPG